MHNTCLDPTTTARLHALATLTGRPESDLLREAVAAYLEDVEDIRAAEESLREIENGGKPLTLDELDAYLDRDLAR
ncbi:MAG: CopG family transcriptional regulator [Gammaproteobacteria bacterium]|jgi:predicted DNA-binding protein|nr:CopG family transcriptional regulator [Gammaproteobacteria bacterium]